MHFCHNNDHDLLFSKIEKILTQPEEEIYAFAIDVFQNKDQEHYHYLLIANMCRSKISSFMLTNMLLLFLAVYTDIERFDSFETASMSQKKEINNMISSSLMLI